MTDQQPHTPTVDELRRMYALKVPHDQRDRRNAEFDRFVTAAEQRGAVRELRQAAFEWARAGNNTNVCAWLHYRADQTKGTND